MIKLTSNSGEYMTCTGCDEEYNGAYFTEITSSISRESAVRSEVKEGHSMWLCTVCLDAVTLKYLEDKLEGKT